MTTKPHSKTSTMAKTIIILTIILLISTKSLSFSPENPSDRRILVLLDDFAIKSSHYIYFNSLSSRGYSLDFKLSDDPKLALKRYGQYLYDGLIIFAPSVDRFGGSINQAAVLDFVDSGRDLIVALDVNSSDFIREIATECGVDFDEDPGAMVIDHTSYALSGSEGDHTLVASDNFVESDIILGSKKIEAPVLFQGIGHSVNPSNNLVLKVLSASPSAYSSNPSKTLANAPSLTGSSISLVSVVQARNNARVLISGSLKMFSDRFLRSGVQKVGSSNRWLASSFSPLRTYTANRELLITPGLTFV
ncbi:dolichyl-diphosphooligosaccharide--protein glycosyltransferase 48 kDa subunit-like [Silene latifolia]|uniref:dolichyl-diphosphooligosaccharide--protein glycosyltransferase 48 kDa subunit-like n=1 Tax=Silene latifolia TaxID=37657 RepID=UPI003D77A31F